MTAARCFWNGDPEDLVNARLDRCECYCPKCAEGLTEEDDRGRVRPGYAAEGAACVRCDRLSIDGQFDFPTCAKCKQKTTDDFATAMLEPPRKVYFCNVCWRAEAGTYRDLFRGEL